MSGEQRTKPTHNARQHRIARRSATTCRVLGSEMLAKQMKKIEELTLYSIELKKEINNIKSSICAKEVE